VGKEYAIGNLFQIHAIYWHCQVNITEFKKLAAETQPTAISFVCEQMKEVIKSNFFNHLRNQSLT